MDTHVASSKFANVIKAIAKSAIASLTLCLVSIPTARTQELSPNAPHDQPIATTAEQAKKLREAIKPLVDQARATCPEAKLRFLSGLPRGQHLYVVTELGDMNGMREQVFVLVTSIDQRSIVGKVASDVALVRSFKKGDLLRTSEDQIVDWLISKPDGSEEGNIVGKYLDAYRP